MESRLVLRRLNHENLVRKNGHLLRCHFILKTIILPRQARDKHRENLKKRCVFRTRDVSEKAPEGTDYCLLTIRGHSNAVSGFAPFYDDQRERWMGVSCGLDSTVRVWDLTSGTQVRKRYFLSTFYIKMMILRRQARDKHRESTQKKGVSHRSAS
eukprot:COSAG06_NODE_1307_length_9916_cov_99.462361_15_plen_155_part_00